MPVVNERDTLEYTDLGLVTWLSMNGVSYIGTRMDESRSRILFLFPKEPRIADLFRKYQDDSARVSPREFAKQMRLTKIVVAVAKENG